MSLYRFKIRTNRSYFSGGTNSINPMIHTGHTGNQKFNSYLTIYRSKPGQTTGNGDSYNDLKIPDPNFVENIANILRTPTQLNFFQTSPGRPLSNRSQITSENTTSGGFNDVTNNTDLRQSILANPFEYVSGRKKLFKSLLVSSGSTIDFFRNFKNIAIPIENLSLPTDYSDDIDNWVKKETKKSINIIKDKEKLKYLSNPYPGITLKFRFYNKDTNQFDDTNLSGGYTLAGFNNSDINIKNNFKKSYFRLYFFDSNDTRSQNLLLNEEISVFQTTKPEFKFKRIFWLKEDEIFLNTNNNRTVYMEAKFFNAKTGRVQRFINTPISVTTPLNILSLRNNQDWKSSKLNIINPKNNNGNHTFQTVAGFGSNTQNTITLTEYILET